MIQNNQHGGSELRFAPFAKLDDGYLDAIVVTNTGRGGTIDLFDQLKRSGSHVFGDTVMYRRFKKLTLTCRPEYACSRCVTHLCGAWWRLFSPICCCVCQRIQLRFHCVWTDRSCHRVMLVCIDGENSGETPMTVECLHNALRVFALA